MRDGLPDNAALLEGFFDCLVGKGQPLSAQVHGGLLTVAQIITDKVTFCAALRRNFKSGVLHYLCRSVISWPGDISPRAIASQCAICNGATGSSGSNWRHRSKASRAWSTSPASNSAKASSKTGCAERFAARTEAESSL